MGCKSEYSQGNQREIHVTPIVQRGRGARITAVVRLVVARVSHREIRMHVLQPIPIVEVVVGRYVAMVL